MTESKTGKSWLTLYRFPNSFSPGVG